MKAYYLSDSDAAAVREVLQEYRRRNRNFEESPFTSTRHPHSIEEMPGCPSDDILTPEVYIAEIPEDGIPALTVVDGNYIPGKAECIVQKLWPIDSETEELVETHFDHLVHNISTSTISRVGDARFQIIWRDKFGRWFAEKTSSAGLVELCSLEDAVRNTPYTALLGTWSASEQIWCYDNAETVYAIDHRIGPPHAEIGWKGLYQEMPSTGHYHEGRIYVCVSLDCELPPEGCNECEGTGS